MKQQQMREVNYAAQSGMTAELFTFINSLTEIYIMEEFQNLTNQQRSKNIMVSHLTCFSVRCNKVRVYDITSVSATFQIVWPFMVPTLLFFVITTRYGPANN